MILNTLIRPCNTIDHRCPVEDCLALFNAIDPSGRAITDEHSFTIMATHKDDEMAQQYCMQNLS